MMSTFKNLDLPIAIIGLGLSGNAALRLLLCKGVPRDKIALFDDKAPADYNDPQVLLSQFNPRTLVVSPGYPLKTPWLQKALQENRQLTSELSLACLELKSEKIIGITGSVGKSTTTSLIGHGLLTASYPFFIGGNLGHPLADYVCDVLEKKRACAEWIGLELSSYQLENAQGLQLDAAIITFFTGNHLERYESIDDYYQVKARILGHTKGPVFINSESADLVQWFKNHPSHQVQIISPKKLNLRSQPRLIGSHNLQNIALASEVGHFFGLKETYQEALLNYPGLAHRLENVGIFNGVHIINDSKATAMDSVLSAVASLDFEEKSSLWILLGGKDKNLPWEMLSELQSKSYLHPVFFGACRETAKIKSGLNGPMFETMEEATLHVLHKALAKDTVLLSPGGTSLDQFKNFEERGRCFKMLVQEFYKS